MKKLFTLIVLSILLTFSSGCAEFGKTSQNALSVITTSNDLYYYYENGEVVNFIDQVELTELELTQVLEALDQAERSKEKLKLYKDNPEMLISDISQITFQYVKIKGAYLSVRSVVSAHWEEYKPTQQQVFLMFDARANTLDREFVALNNSITSNEAIVTAIALASTAIKLSAIL